MSDLLWQKTGVRVDPRIMKFLAGDDVLLDRELLPYDIVASKAHAQGLGNIDILTPAEVQSLSDELDKLAADVASGDFVLDDKYEDGHSAIESRLIERLGDVGRKIHTGRSRNDQVLVASRLWLKARLVELQAVCRDIAATCLQRAGADETLPLPGYTHLQRAMVSSTAMWFSGYAEAFIDNAVRARQALTDEHLALRGQTGRKCRIRRSRHGGRQIAVPRILVRQRLREQVLACIEPARRQSLGAQIRLAQRRRHLLAECQHLGLPGQLGGFRPRVGGQRRQPVKPVLQRRAVGQTELVEHGLMARGNFRPQLQPPLAIATRLGDGLEFVGDSRKCRHDDEHAFSLHMPVAGDAADGVPAGTCRDAGAAKLDDDPAGMRAGRRIEGVHTVPFIAGGSRGAAATDSFRARSRTQRNGHGEAE